MSHISEVEIEKMEKTFYYIKCKCMGKDNHCEWCQGIGLIQVYRDRESFTGF